MRLVDQDRLAVSLFHGTASLFVESIASHGLGGRNPIRELAAIETLRELVVVADRHLAHELEWQSLRIDAEPMAFQRLTAGGFNYRHGATCLSPSRLSAVRYALSNHLGSELLSQAEAVWKLLAARVPDACEISTLQDHPALLLIQSSQPEPILVEVSNPPLSHLWGERDEPALEIVDSMEFDDPAVQGRPNLRDMAWQQHNFELLHPIPPEMLTIYRIEQLNQDQIVPGFQLHPWRRPTHG
jgi:hypothetical protein